MIWLYHACRYGHFDGPYSVAVDEANDLISAELVVEYDTALLTLVGANSTGTLSDGRSVETNTNSGPLLCACRLLPLRAEQNLCILTAPIFPLVKDCPCPLARLPTGCPLARHRRSY